MMGRKTIWRSFTMESRWQAMHIESTYLSSIGAVGVGKVFSRENNYIETNISLRNLRLLFSGAGIRMPDCVTDTMPLDERAKEWEREDITRPARRAAKAKE